MSILELMLGPDETEAKLSFETWNMYIQQTMHKCQHISYHIQKESDQHK